MSGPRLPSVLAAAVLFGLGAEAAAQSVPGCTACHQGAARQLQASPHRELTRSRTASAACTMCHVGAGDHARGIARGAVVDIPTVARTSCSTCHTGADWPTSHGDHSGLAEFLSRPAPQGDQPQKGNGATADAARRLAPSALGFDWSGLASFGYRFLSRSGSRDRYKTDLNLDRGFRLREFELTGTAQDGDDGTAWADSLSIRARDIGDPYQSVEGRVEKHDVYRAEAGFDKRAFTYRASGEYHRIDRKTQTATYGVAVHVDDDLEVFGRFRRQARNGFWLTQRIGNRNVQPQTAVDGVTSPRRYDRDLAEFGIEGQIGETSVLLAAEYLDDTERANWNYRRPAPANPSFDESEDFNVRSSLRGPGARFAIGRELLDGVRLDVTGRYLDLDRRVRSNGAGAGFDIDEFTTSNRSESVGSAETFFADATLIAEVSDSIQFEAQTRWLDHGERMVIDQVDRKVYPNLNSQSQVTTQLDQRTSQRRFDGFVSARLEILPALEALVGYGFVREWLRVPDLEANDPDFVSGLIQNDGLLTELMWRPTAHWSVETGFRQFGQNGVQLHDIVEDWMYSTWGKVRYRTDDGELSMQIRDRRAKNQVSRFRYQTLTTGIQGSLRLPARELDLHGSYTYSDIDTRTLTNFFFDPDPNPVATFVGFDGDTHTVTGGLGWTPDQRVTWRFDGVYTSTRGSFDVDWLDLVSDMRVRVSDGGELGVEVRYAEYGEAGNLDDYDAVLTMVYWRQRLGGHRDS